MKVHYSKIAEDEEEESLFFVFLSDHKWAVQHEMIFFNSLLKIWFIIKNMDPWIHGSAAGAAARAAAGAAAGAAAPAATVCTNHVDIGRRFALPR